MQNARSRKHATDLLIEATHAHIFLHREINMGNCQTLLSKIAVYKGACVNFSACGNSIIPLMCMHGKPASQAHQTRTKKATKTLRWRNPFPKINKNKKKTKKNKTINYMIKSETKPHSAHSIIRHFLNFTADPCT